MWIQSLDWQDPLEKGMTNHSSILTWRIPKNRGAWRATAHSVAKSWTLLKRLSMHTHTDHWPWALRNLGWRRGKRERKWCFSLGPRIWKITINKRKAAPPRIKEALVDLDIPLPNIFKPFHKQKGRQVSHFPHGILPLADWNKQQYWESLDFWWEQLINLCSGPVCWKQEASLHGKSSQLWWSSLQTPCFWLHPFLSSNPHFVRTSAIDALLIPLHPNQSSPTPEDTGFHPK